ncbi:hypothetical protein HNR55_002139 [Acetobacter lovaniensis]|uniref:Uncharacterized protein n=1 Tax=Acetobacter lovaniensis TaxID=104100 RepID=A0A841QH86_9PROT|nr:hypothetical protein [Acetobacter lovaniensis]
MGREGDPTHPLLNGSEFSKERIIQAACYNLKSILIYIKSPFGSGTHRSQ